MFDLEQRRLDIVSFVFAAFNHREMSVNFFISLIIETLLY